MASYCSPALGLAVVVPLNLRLLDYKHWRSVLMRTVIVAKAMVAKVMIMKVLDEKPSAPGTLGHKCLM